MILGIKDRKILYELDIDSRQSYGNLAKKVGLSKESVFYRVKKLADSGIIKRFHTLVDTSKLGYTSFRIFIKLKNTSSRKEKEIINYLKNQKIVAWVVSIEGNWDINMWLLPKTIKELSDFWNSFYDKFVNHIDEKSLSIFTKIVYYGRPFLISRNYNDKAFTFAREPEESKIDNIDHEILKLLVPNSRISILEMANKLDLSPKTVSYRIRNLEKRKVIVGYRLMLDLEKLGYLYYRMHIKLRRINKEKENEFRSFVFRHPNIVYDNIALGGPDLEIDIQVESVEKLRSVIKEIRDKFISIIENYEILEYYKEHKYLTLPVEEAVKSVK
jgi:Lrp/AsnC family leucine-responsive transcriptional regulator